MNMTVKHQIQSSGDNTLSTEKNGGMGNNTDNIIADLTDIIFKMVGLMKQMRDLLNAYNQKQQILGWNIQVNAMSNKREAIDKTASAAIASGACSIVSGFISGTGAGASLKLGDIATHIGSAVGQLSAGSGKLAEGDMTRNAELFNMASGLQSSSAQTYNKNSSELADKVGEVRQNMKEFANTLTNLICQIATAAKF
ncbi:TPA: chemotaxis protein [Yersinia enterocolitica]|uniref:Methyl-accepting chemotaxis protein n=3 Tax=Yersinia enterocolitica TaxID=630 RepID=A0A0H3NUP0_YERE1|nr:hypothetical protein [Yersinia enterocolitica]CBX72590.1 hypothetical protein YEW_HJ33500 [Yersinia enterocolitica W22703]AJJ27404.1 enterobacterial EspB family protein [Yersinia enterocolitica]ALG80290.1 chemotaxis protein [Yersinia enterocolitica]EHB22883.1 Methyl-accepting chemotaxis protein [Yersinia enterocolitica subsp. palearctica PhRBD_Ye1]EKN3313046.1 chemotaxis protein [Yersinia enterocolitica]